MKIDDIIKILWRRKLYLLMPFLIVPLCAVIVTFQMTKEYQTEALIYINESTFKHPVIQEFGLKIDLEQRLPAIKKLMKGENSLLFILGISEKPETTPAYLEELAKKKERMTIELKGPGVARVSYIGVDPRAVKRVVERMAAAYIKTALLPYQDIGTKLKEKLKRRDEVLSVQLLPKLILAKSQYLEYGRNFTDESPDLIAAKYEYETWLEKVRQREIIIEQSVSDILPLIGNDPDTGQLAKIIEPATIPLVPIKPNKKKIVLLAVLSGLALGFILILLMEFLDHSVKESSDIEDYLGLPVIGRVPKIEI